VFGNVERLKKVLLEELRVLGIIEEGRALGVEKSIKKAEIASELERSTLMEVVSWRQKSGSCGSGKVASAWKFFTQWLTSIEEGIPLIPC